jgi:hypothetical protein
MKCIRSIILTACSAVLACEFSSHGLEFNLSLGIGGNNTAFPSESYGMVVVDSGGDGFDFLANKRLLQGTRFKNQGELIGDDDVVLLAGLNPVELGTAQRGFGVSFVKIDTEAINSSRPILNGQSLALVWFPNGRSNPGDTFYFFRTSLPDPVAPGAVGFSVPGPGHTSALIAMAQDAGGHIAVPDFSAQAGLIESPGPIAVDWTPIFLKSLQGEIGSLSLVLTPGDLTSYSAFSLKWTKVKPRQQEGLTVIATVAGQLVIEGLTYVVSGILSDTGLLNLTLKHKTKTLKTQLGWLDGAGTAGFQGSLALSPQQVLPMSLWPASHRGTTADSSPHFGKAINTVLFHSESSPATVSLGHGFFRAVMNRNGSANLSGRLPDGTSFTASARGVTALDGTVHLYFHRILPSKLGHLLGEFSMPLTVDVANGERDLSGELTWLKAERPKSLFNPAAMTARFGAQGLVWRKLTTSLLASVPGQAFSVDFDPERSTSAGFSTQQGFWTNTNRPAFALPPRGTTFSFTASTGLVTGTLAYVLDGKTLSAGYRGIMLPRAIPVYVGEPEIQGFGYMLTKDQSGIMEVRANAP